MKIRRFLKQCCAVFLTMGTVCAYGQLQDVRVLTERCTTACNIHGGLMSVSLCNYKVLTHATATPYNTPAAGLVFFLHTPDSVQGTHACTRYAVSDDASVVDMDYPFCGSDGISYCGNRFAGYVNNAKVWHGVIGMVHLSNARTPDTVWSIEDSSVSCFNKVVFCHDCSDKTVYAIGRKENKNAPDDVYIYRFLWKDNSDTVEALRMRLPFGEGAWSLEQNGDYVFVAGHSNRFSIRREKKNHTPLDDSLDVQYTYILPPYEMLSIAKTCMVGDGAMAVSYLSDSGLGYFETTVRKYDVSTMDMLGGQAFFNMGKSDVLGITYLETCETMAVLTYENPATGEADRPTVTFLNERFNNPYIADCYTPVDNYYHITNYENRHLIATTTVSGEIKWYIQGCEMLENSHCYTINKVRAAQLDVYPYTRANNPLTKTKVKFKRKTMIPVASGVVFEPECTEDDVDNDGEEPVVD